jgi:hypothetical protein
MASMTLDAGRLVLNYGATNVAPTHKDQPLLSSNTRSHFQTHKWSSNKNLVMSANGARNQELFWRGPSAIYCYAMPCHSMLLYPLAAKSPQSATTFPPLSLQPHNDREEYALSIRDTSECELNDFLSLTSCFALFKTYVYTLYHSSKISSSGIQCHVIRQKLADVSEECSASIFMVKY